MNGVAQLAAHAGYRVSGSDRTADLELFHFLEAQGISIFPQNGSAIRPETGAVVYSTAIEADNPDLVRALAFNTPRLHRAEMLANLCKGKEQIAVAGTAGKSTVTGLLGWIFQCVGKDPTIYCGARIKNFDSNVRSGSGPWIIEADESDRSFLQLHPNHAIITNIAEEHFSLFELQKLFDQFKTQVSGIVIENTEDYSLKCGTDSLPDISTSLLGKHNIQNILCALALCRALHLNLKQCKEAVSSFKGIERRLERIGPNLIDDFAHSPIKIAASLQVASEKFGSFSAYWRPHGFTPLFQNFNALIHVFSNHLSKKGHLFILPVYYAGGTVTKKINSKKLVKKLKAAGVSAEFVENYQTLEKRLIEKGLPILGMGARDPELPRFARKLARIQSGFPKQIIQ